jgi:hypothetical protein
MSKKLAKDRKKIHDSKGKTTTGVKKKYSVKAHFETVEAVDRVLKYLESQGIDARPNLDDRFGPDIVVWKGLKPVKYIEVEQRSSWKTGPKFPWETVNVLERKLHLFDLSLPTEIWVISVDHSTALVIGHKAVAEHGELKEISNRFVPQGEKFVVVPRDKCKHIDIRINV